jgi:hypothetical protein
VLWYLLVTYLCILSRRLSCCWCGSHTALEYSKDGQTYATPKSIKKL